MTRNFDHAGLEILDEAVVCDESVDIGGTTYYRGYLDEMAARSILGNTDPDYGVWSAASKGGTRFLAKESDGGVPADSDTGTGSPPDVVLDIPSGAVLSTISQTVYVRYIGHGTIVRASAASASPYIVSVSLPGLMPNGTVKDWAVEKWPEDLNITKYQILVATAGGLKPSTGNIAFQLRDAISGGGNVAADTLDLTSGSGDSGWQTLSEPFEIPTSAAIVIRGDGENAQKLTVRLWHEPV